MPDLTTHNINPELNKYLFNSIAIDEILDVTVSLALSTYYFEGTATIPFRKGEKRKTPQVIGLWRNPNGRTDCNAFVPHVEFQVNGMVYATSINSSVDINPSTSEVTVVVRTYFTSNEARFTLFVLKDRGAQLARQ